jgi:hypothetical protein
LKIFKKIEDAFEKNEALMSAVESRILPRKGYMRVYLDNSTTGSSYADAEILLPPNMEVSENTYPVLVYV